MNSTISDWQEVIAHMTRKNLGIAFGPDAHIGLAVEALKNPVEAQIRGMGETLTRVTRPFELAGHLALPYPIAVRP